MDKRNLIIYFLLSVLAGVMVAFVMMLTQPELLTRSSSFSQAPVSYSNAVSKAAPAVVNIYTAKVIAKPINPLFNNPVLREFLRDYLPDKGDKQIQTSLGSGVIMTADGYILTNYHVIKEADEIQVLIQDGRHIIAEVVGVDAETDLALLQIQLKTLPIISISDSSRLRVGDIAMAIGNPFGVGQAVTQGIVSATGRSDLGIATFENFIQTDAAINPGNSGGALINAFGELIGINTAIYSKSGGSQGIGFAIPVNLAMQTMKQLITYGHTVRGWLGIAIQNYPEEQGVLITHIVKGGPADQVGIKPGDVIKNIDNTVIYDYRNVLNLISEITPGSDVNMTIARDQDKVYEFTAIAKERPQFANQ